MWVQDERGLHRQFQVLEYRVVLVDRRFLELAADTGLGDLAVRRGLAALDA